VIAMCGLAFSGKSTMARAIAKALNYELIVLDAINAERGLDGGKGLTIAQWEETSAIAMNRLRVLASRGRSVVVDDTHSHRFLRDRCKAVAQECGMEFLIVFVDTDMATIDARRAANAINPVRPHIDDDVFAAHRDGFQYPARDEPVLAMRSQDALREWLIAQGVRPRVS
jgi:hypothetical protein